MPYGTINADVIGTSVANTSLGAGDATRFKNRILNGDMRIDQRNAGASTTPTTTGAAVYALDRWATVLSQASKFSIQQNAGSVTPPVGFTNYLGITSLSAYTVGSTDNYNLQQRIEGFNTADLGWGTANAKTVTLSFWVRSSLTGTFGGVLKNSASDRSYPFSYTINSANTWEYETITIAGDTSGTWVGATNGIGINVIFGFGVGSTFSAAAGAWATGNYASATGATSVVGTSGATFYITGVQLEVGSSATGFEYVNYGTQLLMCQRYYWKNQGTAAGSIFGIGNCQTTTSATIMLQNTGMMRSAPTVGYGGAIRIDDGTAGVAVTSLGSNVSTIFTAGSGFNTTSSLTAVGRGVILSASNSTGYVDANAEL